MSRTDASRLMVQRGRCLRLKLEWISARSYLSLCEREGRLMLASALPSRDCQVYFAI